MLAKPSVAYPRFPCVTPAWDNSARRKDGGATIFHDSTPELYERWLNAVVQRERNDPNSSGIIFINAWNEWAEGNHLEPCQKWGHAYLEATKKALTTASQ
jgi:lipopolysaccharide biosynthesis protein